MQGRADPRASLSINKLPERVIAAESAPTNKCYSNHVFRAEQLHVTGWTGTAYCLQNGQWRRLGLVCPRTDRRIGLGDCNGTRSRY
jgi:hypothetical protein